jgi:hypothetical protein
VAGIDRSDDAVRALTFAFEQAAGRGAGLRVIRAWLPPARERTGSPAVVEAYAAIESASLADLVQRWRDKYPGVPVTTEVAIEAPLHCQFGKRDELLGRRWSDGSSESGEGGGESCGRQIVECDVVLAASQILHEGVPGDDHLGCPNRFGVRASVAAGA